jgi:AraC-like DNA-binding protein
MKYNEAAPCIELATHIHSFWELKGEDHDHQWERIFPDGCTGIVINLGDACSTDNGLARMDNEKAYVVGAMTSFKDSFINRDTHLVGVCFKPAAFSAFYKYASQHELTDHTFEFDLPYAPDIGKVSNSPVAYLNQYFSDRKKNIHQDLRAVLKDIHLSKGNVSIYEISKRNFITVRQLERIFKTHIGLTPKEYVKIIRFQSAFSIMNQSSQKKSLSDIAFECGFYDHAHLTNEIKRHTGFTPSQF